MSTFEVKAVKIEDVFDHPNADRLSIVKIGGYNCISAKLEDGTHRYAVGDIAIYIPSSAVLPEWLLKKMEFWRTDCTPQKGSLSGSNGDRVKAIKLRGVVSEGLLYPVDTYNEEGFTLTGKNDTRFFSLQDDVAEYLEIKKYEPTIPAQFAGKLIGSVEHMFKYDIENYLKYPNVFSEDDDIVVTEKIHGTFCAIGFTKDKGKEGQVSLNDTLDCYVSSKGLLKSGIILKFCEENMENIYVKTALKLLQNKQFAKLDRECIIFGEIFGKGVQDLDYGHSSEVGFRMFDWYDKETKTFMEDSSLEILSLVFGIPRVPVLYRGKFKKDIVDKLRQGSSTFANHIREGIVMRSTIEYISDSSDHLKRKQLKYISDDYLLRKNGTEYQ